MAMALDLLEGSSHDWARKHNVIHHSFANITGHDEDIDIGILGRLSPHQRRLPFHRLQHFYLWGLYGFLPVKWYFYDFRDLITGRISGHRIPRPKGWELVVFIGGKIIFFSLAFLVPSLLNPAWHLTSFRREPTRISLHPASPRLMQHQCGICQLPIIFRLPIIDQRARCRKLPD